MSDRRSQAPRRADLPDPGFYRCKLVKNGPQVGVEVRLESGVWTVIVDGIERESAREPWSIPWMRDRYHYADRIEAADHAYLISLSAWAREHDPNHPAANPRQPIRATTLKPLF